jgi:hypothetical protein
MGKDVEMGSYKKQTRIKPLNAFFSSEKKKCPDLQSKHEKKNRFITPGGNPIKEI